MTTSSPFRPATVTGVSGVNPDSSFQKNQIFERKLHEQFERIVPGSSYILESADASLLIDISSLSVVENVFKLGLKHMFISLSGKSKVLLYNE